MEEIGERGLLKVIDYLLLFFILFFCECRFL